MTNKYDNLPLNVIFDRIKNKDIFADCMSDMSYVIAAINYLITPFGYEASWDWLHNVDVSGNRCIHLFLDEI